MDETQVKIRLPRKTRDWLKHQAINNRRSLTKEIASRVVKRGDDEEAVAATDQQKGSNEKPTA